MSRKKTILATLAGAFLAAALLALTCSVVAPERASAATATRSEAWVQARITTLDKATTYRKKQVARLDRKYRRHGRRQHYRRAMLKRDRAVYRLNTAVITLNRVVLAGDYDAEDDAVRRLVRLNRRVRSLDNSTARVTRRLRSKHWRWYAGRLIKRRDRLAGYSRTLGRLESSTRSDTEGGPSAAPTGLPAWLDAPQAPPQTTRTITDLELTAGQSGITYENVRFASSRSYQQATVTITNAQHITFRECVFEGSAWNNITINDFGATVHDITFVDCYVRSAERMGFECTSRGSSTRCYSNVELRRVTFEPQGSEAISFDGPSIPVDCTVQDVLVQGSGTRPDRFPWGQGFEINGPKGFLVQDVTMFRTRDSNWNLNGSNSADQDWTFRNTLVDNTVDLLGGVTRNAHANIICAHNVDRTVWVDCEFRNTRPGAAAAYLSDCDRNRFDGIALSGTSQQVSEVYGSDGNVW